MLQFIGVPQEEIRELIVDAHGCSGDLSDAAAIEKAARRAAESVGANVVESAHHRFQPHGLTLCLILKESHLVISTWPEYELAIVNIFLCNPSMDTKAVWRALEPVLKPSHATFQDVRHRIGGQKAPKKRTAA